MNAYESAAGPVVKVVHGRQNGRAQTAAASGIRERSRPGPYIITINTARVRPSLIFVILFTRVTSRVRVEF